MTEVRKGVLAALRRPKAARPLIRTGVTRAGTVGVEYVHQGVKGWGASQSAARAAWEANRSMAKRDMWAADLEVPVVPDYRGQRANYRSGTAKVGKRYTGAATGTGAPKKVQPTRVAGRKTPGAGITMRDESKPPIDPSLIGKGFAQRVLGDYSLTRSAMYGRAGKGRRKEAFKIVARQMPRMYAHQAVGAATGHAVGTAVARQRGLAGAEAKAVQRKYRRGGMHVGTTTGFRASSRRQAENMRAAGFKKRDRSYNPEHNRQRRLGVATAATGLGGLALMAHGGHGVREATRIARSGIPFAPTAGRPAVILEEQGKKTRVIPVPQRVRQRADDLHSRGITASRRDLGEIGGGASLVGTSAGIHRYSRSRSNREYH